MIQGSSDNQQQETELRPPEKAKDILEAEGQTQKDKEDIIHKTKSTSNTNPDKDSLELVKEARNNGLNSFIADDLFKNITNNYPLSEKLYGKNLITILTGYPANYVKNNLRIPEFREKIKNNITKKIQKAKEENIIDADNKITSKGDELNLIYNYLIYLEKKVKLSEFGEKTSHIKSAHGLRNELTNFKRQSYHDLAIRETIKRVIKRKRTHIEYNDLLAHTRIKKGGIEVILVLDSSASMKGEKLELCKRAAVTLAYKTILEKDSLGLVVFGDKIISSLKPSKNLKSVLQKITTIVPGKSTDLSKAITQSMKLFSKSKIKKHIIIVSDLNPTIGKNPYESSLDPTFKAKDRGITISVVGIFLNKEGEKLGKKISNITEGTFYIVDKGNLDKVLIDDYYSYKSRNLN